MDSKAECKRLLKDGDTEEALLMVDRLITASLAPDDELFYIKGNICRKQQDFQAALNNYLAATTLNPASPAKEAYQMIMDILNFYHKDLYNP